MSSTTESTINNDRHSLEKAGYPHVNRGYPAFCFDSPTNFFPSLFIFYFYVSLHGKTRPNDENSFEDKRLRVCKRILTLIYTFI